MILYLSKVGFGKVDDAPGIWHKPTVLSSIHRKGWHVRAKITVTRANNESAMYLAVAWTTWMKAKSAFSEVPIPSRNRESPGHRFASAWHEASLGKSNSRQNGHDRRL